MSKMAYKLLKICILVFQFMAQSGAHLSTITGLQETDTSETQETVVTESFMDIASQKLTYRVGMGIHRYYFPVIIVVGLIGNVLSVAVMLQPHNRRVSCCVYMAGLGICDTFNLAIGAAYWTVTDSPLVRPLYKEECTAHVYLFHSFQLTGVFIIMTMTADRVIAITKPLKAPSMCTPRRARWSIFAFFIFSFSFCVPYLFQTDTAGGGKLCVTFANVGPMEMAYSWISVWLNCFGPFLILLAMNVIIINAVRKRGKYFKKQGADSGGATGEADSKTKGEVHLTIMLLLVTFAFLILTLPQYLRFVTFLYVSKNSSPGRNALYILLAQGSNKLLYTNNAINFYLYCIGGSKFRRDLGKLLCPKYFEKKAVLSSSMKTSVSTTGV